MKLDDLRFYLASIAESIDYFRIVPRIILLAYSYLLYEITHWFMALETPTTEQSALVVTVVGGAGVVIGLYQKSGKDWTIPIQKWKE